MAAQDTIDKLRESGTANTAATTPATSQALNDMSNNTDGVGVSSSGFFAETDNATSENTRWGYVPENPNYWVRLYQKGTKFDVVANCPQEFEFSYMNEWADVSTLLSNTIIGGFGGRISNIGKALGVYTQSRLTNIQVWTGTKPLEFSLPLIFKAHKDPLKEVVMPVRDIVKMATPAGLNEGSDGLIGKLGSMVGGSVVSSTFLRSPGPNLKEAVAAIMSGHMMPEYAIYMRLGKRVTYPGLVITEVRGKWGNRFTSDGWPISAELTVGFRTFTTWTRAEIANSLFSGQPSSYAKKVGG